MRLEVIMMDIRKRFGSLVRAHRMRLGLTQEGLAERAGISPDMVSKIEGGTSGARFGVIAKLAEALGVDPAELFTDDLPSGQLKRGTLIDITTRIAGLSESELRWLKNLIEAALKPK